MTDRLRRTRSLLALAAVAAAAAAAACSTATAAHEVRVVPVDQPFSLAVGQSASLDGAGSGSAFAVTFVGVTDDSRCPEDAQCVWEGDARLVLRLTGGGTAADTAAHTTTRFTPPPALGGYEVRVEGLAPRQRTDRAIPAGEYVATLRITRRG